MTNPEALPLDLLEAGDPDFVAALRQVHDAEALAGFAAPWFEDRRPASRRLLFEYLDGPLNAFRHEGLIKLLFKKAEAEGDDPLMARFLVLFDRSIRRARGSRRGQPESGVVPRGTTMPRGRMIQFKLWWGHRTVELRDWAVRWYRLVRGQEPPEDDIRKLPAVLERMETLRLFSVATRSYLRRRAWRYFRKLGRSDPSRYLAAATEALALYRDDDSPDDLALFDNWGLVHILFHHAPEIEARTGGWAIRPGCSLAGLAPAPVFEEAWAGSPGATVGLLAAGRSRTVRRWAIRRVEADLDRHRAALPLGGWLDLLGHDDPEVVVLAAEVLDGAEGRPSLGVDRWLALARATDPAASEALAELIGRHVEPGQVRLDQAVDLASLRPSPLARLGLDWLEGQEVGPDDLRTILRLVDAESGPLRPETLRWLRGKLAGSAGFEPSMVLEFLDSRHADVRREGWDWFRSDPRAGDDVETWRKLLESPHADIRRGLVDLLEARSGGADDPSRIGRGLDPEALRQLWAAALLDVRGGGRSKPVVVRQLLRRLQASPGEGPELLPLLGVALRSARAPERRAGLVAVVRLAASGDGEVEALVRSSFPELQIP